METINAIARRKSVRSYKPDQIPEDVLDTILTAGCAAPVASGMYDSLHITVIQDKQVLIKIADEITELLKRFNKKNTVLYSAPTLILVSSKESHMPGIEYANAGCILENMVITATDREVDSVLFGAAAMAIKINEELCKLLSIPNGFSPVLSVALGYAVDDEPVKEHKISMNLI